MEIRVTEITPAQFRARIAEAVGVYVAAMDYPSQLVWQRKPVWHEHSHWHEFSAVAAFAPRRADLPENVSEPRVRRGWAGLAKRRHPAPAASALAPHVRVTDVRADSGRPPSSDEQLVGICYGYRLRPGQWWHDRVATGAFEAGLGLPPLAVELTELHVLPQLQGHGIGRRLLDGFLATRDEQAVLLSTPEVAGESNLAWRLYRRSGFTDLLRDFHFEGDPRPFAVLRKDLGGAANSADSGDGRG